MKSNIAFKARRLAACLARIGWSATLIPVASLTSSYCFAFQFDTGNPDLSVTWDNTVKYSVAWRLQNPDAKLTSPLVNPNNVNLNDGDLNFKKGQISNRFDLLTELDVKYQNVGFRFSGAAWNDSKYLGGNDNPGGPLASPNQSSVAYNQFTSDTRRVHGKDAEVLDAFVFGTFDIAGNKATIRAGKHSVVWGESMFFGSNAIAGGQMPVDIVKLLSVPNTQFKEAIRPVQQISGQLQLTPELTVGAYYQLKWEESRLPAVGSYFSNGDTVGAGAENVQLPPGPPGPRLADLKGRNSGQGGVQIKFRDAETDYGLYWIKFDEKTPQQVLSNFVVLPAPPFPPGTVVPTAYYLAYHRDISAFGASVSKSIGDVNWAAEASVRHNQDLARVLAADTSALTGITYNNSNNPSYPVGNTAHLNVSSIWSIGPTPLFNEATFMGELAWNRLLHITNNAGLLDPRSTRDATAIRFIFTPTYRQAIPGVDLEVPFGLGYGFKGSRSSVLGPGPMPSDGSGDINIGINATYLDGLKLGVAYTHYFGPTGSIADNTPPPLGPNYNYKQFYSDRDFVSFSVRYSF